MGQRTLYGSRPPENFIFTHLRNGANTSLNANGSVGDLDYSYGASNNELAVLSRVLILIVDTGVRIDKFGGLSALENGLVVQVADKSSVLIDFTNGRPITKNSDWVKLAGVDVNIQIGVGADMCAIRWTLGKAGAAMELISGQKFVIKVRDDLSSLVMFHVMVQGQKYKIGG